MLYRIRLLLDYRCYPVWLYDENGDLIDTLLPEELASETELESMFDDLQARYDALFIDNDNEFKFVGFKSEEDKHAYLTDWKRAVSELIDKIGYKYPISDEVEKSLY